VLKSVRASRVEERRFVWDGTRLRFSQADITMMCLSKSQEDYIITMCLSKSQDDEKCACF